MKKIIGISFIGLGFFSPIELMVLILIFILFVDLIVKLFSLKKQARDTGRAFRDLYSSKFARRGYVFKSIGYALVAVPFFPLDQFALTPFLQGIIEYFGYGITLPTPAVFTNLLLMIFSLFEISSINENWYSITGNNILSRVFQMVKSARSLAEEAASTLRNKGATKVEPTNKYDEFDEKA